MATPFAYPVPTPYQSPSQGGNAYVTPGTTGQAVAQSSTPIASMMNGGVLWNTGQVTPQGSVLGANTYSGGGTRPATQTPTTTNAGGGGGGSTTNNTGVPTAPDPVSVDPLLAEANSLFDSLNQYADQAQSAIQNAQPGIENEIRTTGDENRQLLTTTKDRGLATNASEMSDVGKRQKNVASAARQALSETRIGAQQRFGRESGIGRALGEWATVNFQKLSNQSREVYEKAVTALNTQKQQLEQDFTNGMTQINNWVTNKVAESQREFQDKLLQVSAMRADAAEQKAALRIQALSALRDSMQAIQSQTYQFQQSLYLQAQAKAQEWQSTASQLNKWAESMTGTGQQNAGDVNTLMASAQAQPLAGATTSGSGNILDQVMQYMGVKKNPEDQVIN